MASVSTPTTFNPNKPNLSLLKTIYSTILCIAIFSSLLLLHRYDPRVLWLAANAIIFSVYKLSSSAQPNHPDPQPDPHSMLESLPDDRWHDYLSPPAEPEPTEKEMTHADTVGEDDGKVTNGENMDDMWKAIMLRCSSAPARKPSLKKSDTWARRQPRRQRADEVGMKSELKKSVTYQEGREKPTTFDSRAEEKSSEGDTGWRTRDVLVVAHDELFRRVENFIKEQHDHLRLQRQESEYRRFLERFRK